MWIDVYKRQNKDLTTFYSCFNLNRRIIIAEFNGIIKKVVKDLLNLFHISSDIKFMSGEKQLLSLIHIYPGC